MAQLVGDLSQNVPVAVTIQPQNATGSVQGGNIATANYAGDIWTARCLVGAVNTLTTINFTVEGWDGSAWVPLKGVGGINANASITTANTAASFGFFPGNGTVSGTIRGNIPTLTATAANVTMLFECQQRISNDAGFLNSPPSGST